MGLDKISDTGGDNGLSLIEFFEISKDTFIVLDKNFKVTYANPQTENLLNMKKKDIIGEVLWNILPLSEESLTLEKFYKTISNGTPGFLKIFSKSANLWVEISAYLLGNGDLVVNIRDITGKKHNIKLAEEALKDSEKKVWELTVKLHKADEHKRNFISILSHELRNPLATITMALSLAECTPPGDKQDIHMRKIIKHQTAQLIRFVDDLLDVARIEKNKIELIKENIEINEIVKEVIGGFRAQFSEKGIVLEEEYCADFLCTDADPERIRQVIENLLSNSLKFTEKGGTVRLSTFKDDDGNIVIEVSDTGIGIVPELLPDIFEPFVQADDSLARSAGGLGLGLSIVKGIIDLHGGSVVAKSRGLGKGSEFIIILLMG
jgi:PAS domain S-box-containing protein